MPTPFSLRLVIWTWLIAVLIGARLGWFSALAGPGLGAASLALGTATALAALRLPSLRTWLDALDVRALAALHGARLSGFFLVLLADRGALPADFALRTGWSEIVIGSAAVALALWPLTPSARRHALTIWNMAGAVSLALTLLTLVRLGLQEPASLRLFTGLPLSLLPLFLFPLLLAGHLTLHRRLRAPAPHEA